jgi:hypothetical protein
VRSLSPQITPIRVSVSNFSKNEQRLKVGNIPQSGRIGTYQVGALA